MVNFASRASPVAFAALVAGSALALAPLYVVGQMAGGALFVAGAALWPVGALGAVIVTLPFYLFQRQIGGQSVSPTEAALLLAALGIAARMLWDRRGSGNVLRQIGFGRTHDAAASAIGPRPPERVDGWRRFDLPVALFLASALLSFVATEYLRLSLRELRTLIVEPLLFLFLLRAVVRAPADALRLIDVLAAVTTLVAVVAVAQFFIGGSVTDVQGVRRVQGTYTSPNHLALLLGRTIPFLLAAAWVLPHGRPVRMAAGAVCCIALLMTFSLGGWLATGVAIAVVVGLLGGRRWLAALLLAAVLVASIAVTLAPVERLAGRFDPGSGTALVRVQLWSAGTELIRDDPLFGIGLDNFLYRYSELLPPSSGMEPNLSHPHNVILQFWLQLGLAGVVALTWILVAVGLATRRSVGPSTDPVRRALAVGIAASTANFVAHGFIDNGYFLVDMACIFWLMVAGAAALARNGGQPD